MGNNDKFSNRINIKIENKQENNFSNSKGKDSVNSKYFSNNENNNLNSSNFGNRDKYKHQKSKLDEGAEDITTIIKVVVGIFICIFILYFLINLFRMFTGRAYSFF